MIQFICAAIIIALIACWVILFITKIGLREYLQVHSTKVISQMFSCDFCVSWWLCLLLSVCFSIGAGDPVLLFCAFCATPITRYYLA